LNTLGPAFRQVTLLAKEISFMRIPMTYVLSAVALLAAFPAVAGDAAIGAIQIKSAWARATPPGAPAGGAFASIVNTGTAEDTLVGVAADVAKTVELHTHVMDGAVMRMRAVPSIPVGPGQTVALAPGGYHVMLIGLKQPLKAGEHFPLTLTFQHAGPVTVTVDVAAIGAAGPVADMPMMHDPAHHQQMMQDPDHQQMHHMMHGGE
jgi:periplasmic copper chaperone A